LKLININIKIQKTHYIPYRKPTIF